MKTNDLDLPPYEEDGEPSGKNKYVEIRDEEMARKRDKYKRKNKDKYKTKERKQKRKQKTGGYYV